MSIGKIWQETKLAERNPDVNTTYFPWDRKTPDNLWKNMVFYYYFIVNKNTSKDVNSSDINYIV